MLFPLDESNLEGTLSSGSTVCFGHYCSCDPERDAGTCCQVGSMDPWVMDPYIKPYYCETFSAFPRLQDPFVITSVCSMHPGASGPPPPPPPLLVTYLIGTQVQVGLWPWRISWLTHWVMSWQFAWMLLLLGSPPLFHASLEKWPFLHIQITFRLFQRCT